MTSIKADDLFQELGPRLYEWGDSRSPVLQTSPSETQQLPLYYGLRTSDIVVELLRYKWHYDKPGTRQDDWRARLHALLEALRMPLGRCSVHSNSPNLQAGTVPCGSCRYSLLSIAGNVNTLALGFPGIPSLLIPGGDALEDKGVPSKEAAELEGVKLELTTLSSKLSEAQKTIADLRDEKLAVEQKMKAAEEAAKKTTSERDYYQEALRKVQRAYHLMGEAVEAADELAKSNDGSLTTNTAWKMVDKLLEALGDRASFQLKEGIAMKNLANKDDEKRECKRLGNDEMEYRHRRVRALLNVGGTLYGTTAKELAEELLNQRREMLGRDAPETKEIFRDYCKALKRLSKPKVLENEYVHVWHDQSIQDSDFIEEAGIGLAELKLGRDEKEEAVLWYRKVAARRFDRGQGDLAAEAAVKMVMVQKPLFLGSESLKLLVKIWEKYGVFEKTRASPSKIVLSCGQEAGALLVSHGKYAEAKAVFMEVWRALEDHGGKELERRALIAQSLATIILDHLPGHDEDLRELSEWMSSSLELARTRDDKKATLRFQYHLGCLWDGRRDHIEAEKTLRAAWNNASKEVGDGSEDDELAINIGAACVQAILAQADREADAKKLSEEIWQKLTKILSKKKLSLTQQVMLLTAARPYAEVLLYEASNANDEEKEEKSKTANDVLEKAWNKASAGGKELVKTQNFAPLADLLWIGNMYGAYLTHFGLPAKAIEVLKVVEGLNSWNLDPEEVDVTYDNLKKAQMAIAEEKLKKPAEGQNKQNPATGTSGDPVRGATDGKEHTDSVTKDTGTKPTGGTAGVNARKDPTPKKGSKEVAKGVAKEGAEEVAKPSVSKKTKDRPPEHRRRTHHPGILGSFFLPRTRPSHRR